MSKPVASEAIDDYETPKTSRKRGENDEKDEVEEGIIEGIGRVHVDFDDSFHCSCGD